MASRALTISALPAVVPCILPAPSKSSSATTVTHALKSKKSRPSIASARTRQMPKPMPQPQLPNLLPTTRCRSSPNAGYICSSCGAELVSDGTVAVTTCPYCGNSAVAPGQLSGDFSPDLVIPFKLGRDDARPHSRNTTRARSCCPRALSPATTSTRSKVSTCRFGSTAPA